MTIFQFMKFVSEDAKVLNIIDATFSDYKGTSLKISNKYKLKNPHSFMIAALKLKDAYSLEGKL